MFRRVLFIIAYLLLIGLTSTFDTEKPLLASEEDLEVKPATAFSELHACVGDRLLLASPIARPCYQRGATFIEGACSVIKGNIKDDYWLPHQPGGYYYVSPSSRIANLLIAC